MKEPTAMTQKALEVLLYQQFIFLCLSMSPVLLYYVFIKLSSFCCISSQKSRLYMETQI